MSTDDRVHHTRTRYALLGTLGFLLSSCALVGPGFEATYRLDGNTEIGIAFPDLQDETAREFTSEHLSTLGVRTIRLEAAWSFREPQRDSYAWGPMDRRMQFLEDQGLKAVITFPSDAPQWIRSSLSEDRRNPRSVALDAAGNREFEQYVRDVLDRYRRRNPGVIAYLQFGNEWATEYHYVGSGADFAETQRVFYETARDILPGVPVVLGGFSVGQVGGMALVDELVDWIWDDDGAVVTRSDLTDTEIAAFEDRIAIVLNGSHYDAIDFHLYDQYEDWPAYYEALQNRVPVSFAGEYIVTEFGGPHPVAERNLSELERAQRLESYIRAVDSLPDIPLALHFRLVRNPEANHSESGLMERRFFGVRKLPAYDVFRQIVNPGE
ncbi:MAG: beta-galactosidase [Spirochaetaceae bacterium]